MAQLIKNLPEIQETWVRSLGREDPLETGKATHCSILVWRIIQSMELQSRTRLSDFHFHFLGGSGRIMSGVFLYSNFYISKFSTIIRNYFHHQKKKNF